MRFIPTSVHGVLDYLVSAIIIASPWLFGYALGGAEQWVPIALGALAIIASLFTNYELGVVRSISMRNHLILDFINGAILAASPWIFGFHDYVWAPHLVLGLFEIAASLTTRIVPTFGRTEVPNAGRAVRG